MKRIPVESPTRSKEGWNVKDPNNDDILVGPYETKQEADRIRIGLDRFYRSYWEQWKEVVSEFELKASQVAPMKIEEIRDFVSNNSPSVTNTLKENTKQTSLF